MRPERPDTKPVQLDPLGPIANTVDFIETAVLEIFGVTLFMCPVQKDPILRLGL